MFYHLTTLLLYVQVRIEEEVVEAIKTPLGPKNDCLCFIEVIAHKDDTSKELQVSKSSVVRILKDEQMETLYAAHVFPNIL